MIVNGDSTSPTPGRCSGAVLFRCRVILADLGPVDHVEEGLDVIGPAILVIEVVGVFPDIETEDGRAGAIDDAGTHARVVLVGCRTDAQLAVVDAQPRPAGSEPRGTGGAERLLEFV